VLDALAPHTSPGGAFIDIGNTATHYDLRAVYLETFARPLWGLTSLLMGGDTYDGLKRWVQGLANGTNPQGPEYWDKARAKDQRMVEMSPLSFAIAMKPDVFYDVSAASGASTVVVCSPLTPRNKARRLKQISPPFSKAALASRCQIVSWAARQIPRRQY
jgi:hypothetical protein